MIRILVLPIWTSTYNTLSHKTTFRFAHFLCRACIRIATPAALVFVRIPKHAGDGTPSSSSIMSRELLVSLNMMTSHCMEKTLVDCWMSCWFYMHVVCHRLTHLKIQTRTWSGRRWWKRIVTRTGLSYLAPLEAPLPFNLSLVEAPEHWTFQATTSLRHLYVDHPNLPIPHATHRQLRCWKHALSKLIHFLLSMYMVLHLWSERCRECSTRFWKDVSNQNKSSELRVPLACDLAPPKCRCHHASNQQS